MSGPRFDTEEAPAGATAAERLAYAMEQVEAAQYLLAAASRNLSPIIGCVVEWRAVGKLHDRVHSFWYRLEAKLRGRGSVLKLDGRYEPKKEDTGP